MGKSTEKFTGSTVKSNEREFQTAGASSNWHYTYYYLRSLQFSLRPR